MKKILADVYIFAVVAVGAACLVVASLGVKVASLDPLMFVLLLGLAAAAQRNPVMLFRSSAISMSFAIKVAAYVLFGVGVALWVNVVVAAVNAFTPKPKPIRKAAFNFGQLSISTTLAAATYGLVGGKTPPADLVATVVAVAVSAAVYFLTNSTLTAAVIALTSDAKFAAVWKQNFSWMPVNYVATAVNGAALALAYQALGVFGAAVFVLPLGVAWYSFKLYVSRSSEMDSERAKMTELNRLFEQSNTRLTEAHISIVGALLGSLEAKSTSGTAHLAATIYRSVAVAKRLGLDHLAVEAVQLGALFHDLGKIAISDAILQKPDRLGDVEWAEIRAHPIIGASLLAQMPELDHIRPLILAHHERFDGAGYPNALKGDAIPRAAQIIAVADAYEAMTADRPYRRSLDPAVARRELENGRGTQCDTRVLDAFLAYLDEGRATEDARDPAPIARLTGRAARPLR
ncbi:MAG TPA: HD domain-containing phosphohydrolase [Thermoanaerobaculia bacterium]